MILYSSELTSSLSAWWKRRKRDDELKGCRSHGKEIFTAHMHFCCASLLI